MEQSGHLFEKALSDRNPSVVWAAVCFYATVVQVGSYLLIPIHVYRSDNSLNTYTSVYYMYDMMCSQSNVIFHNYIFVTVQAG